MTFTTLIASSNLAGHLGDPDWVVVDCRFSLAEPERGRRDYLQAHIPGALYAHLDEDLSRPVVPGRTGRHPLPEAGVIADRLSNWGIDAAAQVVAYDDSGGSIAARLWWMLRWLGHDAVAVLDGGFPAWLREGKPTRAGVETRPPREFRPRLQPNLLATTGDVLASLSDGSLRVFDARAPERYRGEVEPIDSTAGHIPGAVCVPYELNVGPDGRFLPREELRARYRAALGDAPAAQAVFYCGSGVTAAHNILALAHAGLGDARLYAGSWSEWIADPQRPVVTGEGN